MRYDKILRSLLKAVSETLAAHVDYLAAVQTNDITKYGPAYPELLGKADKVVRLMTQHWRSGLQLNLLTRKYFVAEGEDGLEFRTQVRSTDVIYNLSQISWRMLPVEVVNDFFRDLPELIDMTICFLIARQVREESS
jgi:hypothetical protein